MLVAFGKKFGLVPGLSRDLSTGWTFDKQIDEIVADEFVSTVRPLVVVGSPMCTMFRTLPHLAEWDDKTERKKRKAREHIG